MSRNSNPYDRAVRSVNDADRYELSGESEYSREHADPYLMVDYLIDRAVDFRGKGPRGWKRPDHRILDEVCEILARDSAIDATGIEVRVQEGVVYLKGHVPSRQIKRLSELAIENLLGVTDVVNQLSYRHPKDPAWKN
jgi:osmotically-inducible protein OsmY